MGTLTIDLNRWVNRTGEFMFIFSPDKGVQCKLGADDLAFSIEPTVCTPCRPGSVGRTVSIDSFLKECMVREALEGALVEGVESRPILKPRLCSRVSAIMVIPPLPPPSP